MGIESQNEVSEKEEGKLSHTRLVRQERQSLPVQQNGPSG